jgi:hypothetical protein
MNSAWSLQKTQILSGIRVPTRPIACRHYRAAGARPIEIRRERAHLVLQLRKGADVVDPALFIACAASCRRSAPGLWVADQLTDLVLRNAVTHHSFDTVPLVERRLDTWPAPTIRHGASPNSCPGTGNRSTPPAPPPNSAHSPSAYALGMDRPRPEPASDVGQGKRLSPGAELVPGFHQRLHGLSEQGRLCQPANAAAGLPPAPEISVRHGRYAWCQKRNRPAPLQ